jgi:hypothetical protein
MFYAGTAEISGMSRDVMPGSYSTMEQSILYNSVLEMNRFYCGDIDLIAAPILSCPDIKLRTNLGV